MCEDEIYITCICGKLVNKIGMGEHIESCLKDAFVRKATSLKISKSSDYREQPYEVKHVCGKCIRCGECIYKDEGKLITFYPLIPHSAITCCTYQSKSDKQQTSKDSVGSIYDLHSFHKDIPENANKIINCIDDIENTVKGVSKNIAVHKCLKLQADISKFLETLPNTEEPTDSEDTTNHTHIVVGGKRTNRPACSLFHIALFPNYNKKDENGLSHHTYSLLLQILDTFSQGISVATQTDLSATREYGVLVKLFGAFPEESEEILGTGKNEYDVPDFDPKAEAAYRSHLSTLIPCKHCSRTFSPDRIQKHMSCCIERPRTREYITPTRE